MSASRVTLPEVFYDKTSDMLLRQPEPQYLFASTFLAALGASLPVPDGLGFMGGRTISGQGGYRDLDSDRLKLAQNLPSEIMAAKVDFSAAPGNSIRINRPKFLDSTYTEASRKVVTGQTISTTPIKVESEQTNLTLFRFAGPYDNDNSRVAPYAIEAFDANMGIQSASKIIGNNLARDWHKFLDSIFVTLGDVGASLYPDGMSADNDATIAGSFPMTLEMISRLEEEADASHLPTFGDGSRMLVLTPKQWKQLKHDPEYMEQAEFHKEFNLLYSAYVGSVSKTHLFKSTTLKKVANGSSVDVHRGLSFCPGALMAGMGRRPRVAASTDDNYGEQAKVVWIADLAFGVADSRFIRTVRSA